MIARSFSKPLARPLLKPFVSQLFSRRCIWGSGSRILQTIDLHAAGEPARVVTSGVPHVPGITMAEKRTYLMEHMDGLRKLLLQEPRGYPCQNANLVLPSSIPGCSFGFVILEQNKIYPMMSGHNAICVATALLETGMVPMAPTGEVTKFALEAPCGPISIEAKSNGHGKVVEVKLRNAPAFVPPGGLGLGVKVPHGGVGDVTIDVAYGGMWYAVVEASEVGLDSLEPSQGKDICRLGEMIKVAAREQHPFQHPHFHYPGPDILVFRAPPAPNSNAHAMNAVVMSNGELDWNKPATWTAMLDRSPCGTGTCAVMATMWAKGQLGIGEDFVHAGLLGTTFTGCLEEEIDLPGGYFGAPLRAVVPTIRGQAWITQHCQVVVDPTDPFPAGYTVGDLWAS